MSRLTNYTREHAVGFTLSIVAVVVALLFAYSIYDAVTRGGKVKVTVSVAPKDAALLIDGKASQEHTLYVAPGKHTFSASKDGYESYDGEVYIEKDQGDTSVALSLPAKTDDAKKEADENQADYLENEGIAGKQANADGARFRDKNPIVSKLPYKTMLYTIGYQSDTSDPSGMSIIVTVDANDGMRADVVAQIARWGYDPTELNIQFRNYRNPFQ